MKKITLLLFILSISLNTYAQDVVWSDNFDDEDISDWTLIDADGDTFNWGDLFQVTDALGAPVSPVSLISRSWQTIALTPDNWAISPAIDLSGASGTITVEWITQVAAASWDLEKYSIHVGTSSDTATLVNATTSMTETLGQADDLGTPTNQSLDISSLAGEAEVYIALRHWDTTDQDWISIDDLTVTASTLSVNEFDSNSFSYYYDNNLNTLKLESNTNALSSINIHSVLGQNVMSKSLSNTSELINLPALSDGVYLAEVEINGQSKTIKFIKN
ncbi:T9SS type A sorting domain-containing protein [Winogradskyella vidalii]|uniref:T9SS type A sorting domain-containing protein n=1 Tax=Winogradskyella vidalii TaxID=2615024 RepID=UPI0015CE124E|nr:T9SS type A sorting domain-containing protein [Winogradskyella vidalii]